MNYFAWLDIETTGLYGRSEYTNYGILDHNILEIALVITNLKGDVLKSASYVVRNDYNEVVDKMNDYVFNMHDRSGLLNTIKLDNSYSLYEIESRLVEMMEEVCGDEDEKPYMAGSSVHFDRFFVSMQMPRLNEKFHYRNFDVSTLELFYKTIAGEKLGGKSEPSHIAIEDVTSSINRYKAISQALAVKKNFKETIMGMFK